MIGARRMLQRRKRDPLADRFERAPGDAALWRDGLRVRGRMRPGEEQLEVAVRLAARLEPGDDLGSREGAPALLGGSLRLIPLLHSCQALPIDTNEGDGASGDSLTFADHLTRPTTSV
jgi:hypothetical protein